MKFSKLTTKYQASIPPEIREVLNLDKGDRIAFDIVDRGSVMIRKASAIDLEFADAVSDTMSEWASEHDEAAYSAL